MSLSQDKFSKSVVGTSSHYEETSKTARLNGEKDKIILANDSLI